LKVKNGGNACNSSYLRSRRILSFRPAGARLLIPYLKNKMIKHKKVGGIAQVVEHLPSMHKALNSISNTEKKKILCKPFQHINGYSSVHYSYTLGIQISIRLYHKALT
jgi:hypothetical protein